VKLGQLDVGNPGSEIAPSLTPTIAIIWPSGAGWRWPAIVVLELVPVGGIGFVIVRYGLSPVRVLRVNDRPPARNAIERFAGRPAQILFGPRQTRAVDERAEQVLLIVIALSAAFDALGLFHRDRLFPGASPLWAIAFAGWVGAAVVYDATRPLPAPPNGAAPPA
jgi:hypothetical protein